MSQSLSDQGNESAVVSQTHRKYMCSVLVESIVLHDGL